MAITALEYMVLSMLRAHRFLPPKPRVLELGESNWYGDVNIEELARDIQRFNTDAAQREAAINELREVVTAKRPAMHYEIGRLCFKAMLDYSSYSAIDPATPSAAYRFDLNQPVPLHEQFDITMNIGTGEHVFNVWQFYKTAHERTANGGLMLHSAPFTGWIDHGFYTFQPTFFFDLARTNQYQILLCYCADILPLRVVQINNHAEIAGLLKAGKIPAKSHIAVVFRKASQPVEFTVPMQGYYAGQISQESHQAWHDGR